MLEFSKQVKVLFVSLFLLSLVSCTSSSSSSQQEPRHSHHKSIINTMHKGMMSREMTSNIRIHGILLWVSMGFLMPLGILIIRLSNREQQNKRMIKLFFYLHLIFQTVSVLLVTAGAIMSIKKFENSFDNNHQRIGLALYAAIWIQAGIGFLRPTSRESKRIVTWYLVHWILGTIITLVGIINIFLGLQAYHQRSSKSTFMLTLFFTLQVSFMAFFFLFQDKWNYIQKQGLILGEQQPITIEHAANGAQIRDNTQKNIGASNMPQAEHSCELV